jgi:hypothetical protein
MSKETFEALQDLISVLFLFVGLVGSFTLLMTVITGKV